MRKMTITEALVELKLLDKRISRVGKGGWCAAKMKAQSKTTHNEPVDEYTDNVKSRYASIKDLISGRARIKAAIVDSNAKTVIEIGDLKMTVAEAIDYKASIEYEKILLQSLRASKADTEETILTHKIRVQNEVDKVINKLAESGKDNLSDEQKKFAESYREMNEIEMVDPIGIDAEIKALEEKIDTFESNVDTALSIANATTFIEV